MYITYYDIKHVYLSKYSHSDKTTEIRININNRSTTILVKTISTLGLGADYMSRASPANRADLSHENLYFSTA